MIVHIVRAVFLLVVMAFSVSYALSADVTSKGPEFTTFTILLPTLLAFGLVMLDMFWERKQLHSLSGMFFGVLAGLSIAYILSLLVDLAALLLPAPPVAAHPGPQPIKPTRPPQPMIVTGDPNAAQIQAQYERTVTRYHRGLENYTERSRDYAVQMRAYRTHQRRVQTVQLIKLLLGGAAVYLCVSFVLQTKDDFRFVIPYVEFSRQTKGARPFLLDTSVIIDGRIADIAETKIFESEILVPRFILGELQSIADSDDKLKRNRGRRGLDVLNGLQGSDSAEIRIFDRHVREVDEQREVDAKLVALAEHLNGRVVTNDYNLNKVAQLRGVDVININDLANALKPVVLPGEGLRVKVIKPGEEPGQGVGYLEDGTMVVAERGRDYIGREISIVVTSVLQTSAGKMIFGKLDAGASDRPGV